MLFRSYSEIITSHSFGVTPQEFFTGAGDETDRINIFNRLQDLDDGDIQKLQTFLGWMEEK